MRCEKHSPTNPPARYQNRFCPRCRRTTVWDKHEGRCMDCGVCEVREDDKPQKDGFPYIVDGVQM